MSTSLEQQMNEINEDFCFIHDLLEEAKVNPTTDYEKVNLTYFQMFSTHYESFYILLRSNHFSSGILLMRSMLELYVKSFYLEFIAKNKSEEVMDYLDVKIKYPSFFAMVKELGEFESTSGDTFDNFFSQLTKSQLASYEKFSFFSHGSGEYVKAFYKNGKISFTSEQISDVIETAKGMFLTFAMLLFAVQGKNDQLGKVLEKFNFAETKK
ncbi:DUF6988 family protein [Vreelandella alkaliphila]|uniref:Uncharacterized protein n=1 Tax=Vreelandella alkaliphila TaxID=272774 RepID=A0AAJ2RUD9_9GAMM|nr:hypothetical protein [Halomonas alkaliphila]MDX5976346.1 hypothetical protein [Halomonas alkaliphila]